VPLAVLLETSRVAAEATVGRLQARAIDAEVLDEPNFLVKLACGGNYRVRVAVPEEELERARGELALWAKEAGPRVEQLSRSLRLGFFLGSLPALALLLWLVLRSDKKTGLWIALAPAWLAGLMAWAWWSRRRAVKRAVTGTSCQDSPTRESPTGA
jgi:hypothetical protein